MPDNFVSRVRSFSRFGGLRKEIPHSVNLNLNPKYELRGYQIELLRAFSLS